MSEQTDSTNATDGPNDSQSQGGPKEFEAITSQEDFDKAIQARIARERAKFTDYEALKAKAAQFDAAENAKKTDDQKHAERLADLEKNLEAERTGRLRAEVAATKKVPAALLIGKTREELEASAEQLINYKTESTQDGYVAPNEGRQSGARKLSAADEFAQWSEAQNF